MDSIIDTLRWLLMWIDFAVYTMIEKIYYLFLMLSEATVLNDEIITNFTSKVYVLISLIMLFRLAFSFINYIVNPDTITDKQKGGGKLITNIVISIALLVSIPTIFHELYYLQGVIVQQNVIEKLVLGESTITENGEDSQITAANYLSLYAFTSFFTPNQAIEGCAEPFTVSNGVKTLTSSCLSALDQASTKDKNVGTNYNNALANADLMYIAQGGMADEKAAVTNSQYVIEKQYLFEYSYIISTIFGLALCFILIGFCFDLAIRIIKLGFLQLIAPIPIVLNMAPASKNNYLGNFGKEVVSTWVSLFIRIAVVTFAIYFIQLVFMSGVTSFVSGEVVSNPFVNAFVMMGLLMFAKEFPKLLEELLGLKGAGKLTLNPLKKINEGMIGGGLIGGAVAGLAGGGIGGAIRGAWAGRNAKTLTEATQKAAGANVKARQLREIDANPIRRSYGRATASLSKATGRASRAERIEEHVKELESRSKVEQNAAEFYEAQMKTRSDIRSHVLDELENKNHSADAWSTMQNDIITAKSNLEAAQASGNAAAIAAAIQHYNSVKETAVDAAINANSDGYMRSQIDQYNSRIRENNQLAQDAHMTQLTSGASLNADLNTNKNNAQTAANTRNAEVYRLNEEVRRINESDVTRRAKQYRDSVK